MKKILFYENRKSNPIAWDASTQEQEEKAFLSLFKYLDKEWELFCDITEGPELELLKKARERDAVAAKKLLKAWQFSEYCNWHEIVIENYLE